MIPLLKAELRRLRSTRLWLGALLTAVVAGGGLVSLLGLLGPQNLQPPMPGLDTAEGVRSVLGVLTFTVLMPAVFGTIAMTSEYRHGTIGLTFQFAPRRWTVLTAKLVAFAIGGICYGLAAATSAGLALYGTSAVRGVTVGLDPLVVLELLLRVAVTMAIYTLLGAGIGALLRNQVAALVIVVGYLYAGELAILAIPGVNTVYPYLPGGATAALNDFGYLTESMARQTGNTISSLMSATAGALILAGYAVLAAISAIAFPLRRDVT